MAKTFGDYFLRGLEQGQERGSKAAEIARAAQQKADLENWLQGQQVEGAKQLKEQYGANTPVKIGDAFIGNPEANASVIAAEREREDRAVERLGEKVDKSGIAEIAPALRQAESSFKGSSVGPIINMLPTGVHSSVANVMSRVSESPLGKYLGVSDTWKGAGEEFQDLQKLLNIDTRKFTGANSTKFEVARKKVEQGLRMGGSKEQVAKGIASMRAILESEANNIQASFRPSAVETYTGRQGIKHVKDLLGPGPGKSPMGPQSPADGLNPGEIKVRDKKTGQIGAIPQAEFDESIYEQVR